MKKTILLIASLFLAPILYGQVVVSTLAGQSSSGSFDGTGTSASFNRPIGTAQDAYGNVYVCDNRNHRIRKITPAGVVSTLAGSSSGTNDGTGTQAQFYLPWGLDMGPDGNLYVGDLGYGRIRKVTPSGVVSTLASVGDVLGICVDNQGNVYAATFNQNVIKKITPTGTVSVVAGSGVGDYLDGTGTSARFNQPYGVAVDDQGVLYVADYNNHRIRKISPSGVVTTLAGSGTTTGTDGTGTLASLFAPAAIDVDSDGSVFVMGGGYKLRKISPSGVVTTIAGSNSGFLDGTGTDAKFGWGYNLRIGIDGNIYIGDYSNNSVRMVTGAAAQPLQALFRTSNFNGYAISGSGNTDGEIRTLVLGGKAPYTYSWTGPGRVRGANPSGLGEGVYFLEVTDNLGEMVRIGPINMVAKP